MPSWFRPETGQTPLSAEDREGLRVSITTLGELNALEAANVAAAASWAVRQRSLRALLTVQFVQRLHKRMFGEVWSWAGRYRVRQTNLGVEPYRIPLELIGLLDSIEYWQANRTFPIDEIAVRLHHQLAWIHPFPNGNGRHARLMTDLYLHRAKARPFSWGAGRAEAPAAIRAAYIRALRSADRHELTPLLQFVRS